MNGALESWVGQDDVDMIGALAGWVAIYSKTHVQAKRGVDLR
jgi:hypothetical protein